MFSSVMITRAERISMKCDPDQGDVRSTRCPLLFLGISILDWPFVAFTVRDSLFTGRRLPALLTAAITEWRVGLLARDVPSGIGFLDVHD